MALDSDLIAEWTDAVQDGYTLYRKQIDNYPGEGSWPSYASRATTFFGLVRRQFFYEPLRDYDAILAALNYTQMQTEAYLPDHCVDHVQISFSIFEGAGTAPNGRLQMPRSGERKRGLHAVRLVGWDDSGEVLLFRNSWGAGWGDQGYGSMDRRYVDAYMYDAWLMRNARYGLARHTWDKYHAASTPVQRRAILLQDNPRWRGTIRYAGMNYQIFIYETLSINDERPAEIIELSNRDGIRVGWCETFYGSGTSAIIKELFVWPPFRRRGYGTILEAAAVIRTQGWVDELVLWFYEPDAIPRSRANGRLFALGRGYEWTWRKSSRPAPAGTAAKRIDITKAERTLRPRETDSMLIPIRRTHMVESLRHEVDSQRGYSMLCFVKVSSCELRETIRCLGRSMSCKVKSGCLVRDLTVESGLAACRDIGAVEVCRE